MSRGKLITVEGVEGAGKSTHMPFIRDFLTDARIPVISTREPGGTALGESLRGLLLEPRGDPMASDAELLLMFAARAEHLDKVIQPALEAGKWVLCDRFTDASYAYQGGGRGIQESRIAVLEKWVQGNLRPDLVLVLDVPLEVGFQRIGQRSGKDRFEREERAFFERVRATYQRLARKDPRRYRLIDASGTLKEAQRRIRKTLKEALPE